MKKLNRREKTILQLMLAFVGIAALSEGWDWYSVVKEDLSTDIARMESEITAFSRKLENESAEQYRQLSVDIEEDLEDAQARVLELPKETDANLLLSQTISEQAEHSGLTINSISTRKSQVINEEKNLRELRTYFGYDTDLVSLLKFFEAIEDQSFFVAVETLNISARRQPKRRKNSKRSSRKTTRRPLNGNAILTTVFRPNPDASLEQYELDAANDDANKDKDAPSLQIPEGDEDEDDDILDPELDDDALADEDDEEKGPELTRFPPKKSPVQGNPKGDTPKLQPKPRKLTKTAAPGETVQTLPKNKKLKF